MQTQTTFLQVGTWNSRNLLTVLEVADWARVHPKTVYRWIRNGKLEAIQFGPRTFRVPEDALRRFLRLAEQENTSSVFEEDGKEQI
jgi:excisionase family DNA binding protein